MKTLRTVQQVRESMGSKKLAPYNGRVAAIVTIPISKRKQDLGIQFWRKSDIDNGYVFNSDGSKSTLIELY